MGQAGGLSNRSFNRLIKRGLTPVSEKGRKGKGPTMHDYGRALMDAARISRQLPFYTVEEHVPVVQKYYDANYPGMYRIVVFSTNGDCRPVFVAKERAKFDVCIYYNGEHFDGVRNVNGLFGPRYYCIDCERPYSDRVSHTAKCKRRCKQCARIGPEYPCKPDGYFHKCQQCNKTFRNRICYREHMGTMCKLYHRCLECGVEYNTKEIKRLSPTGTHECEYRFCTKCHTYHKIGRECYIPTLELRKDKKEVRFVAFDFESTQEGQIATDRLQHNVNFVCASVFCSKCIRKEIWRDDDTQGCQVCGPKREYTWSAVSGEKPLEEFAMWMLYSLNKKYETVAFSHFGGRYDMTLVLGQLYKERGLKVDVVRCANKLYQIKVAKPKMITTTYFRDSFNLMPQSLAALVDAYALQVKDKPFFPHLYNLPSNYISPLNHLPDRHYYCPESFSIEKREEFERWYNENYSTPFDLPKELESYCKNDVDILKHALVAYRTEWITITGDDVLRNSMTIASACMRHFRAQHMEKDTLSLTPEHGVERHDNQSVIALKYLKWYSHKTGVQLRHRDSTKGEYRHEYIDKDGRKKTLRLDGYAPTSGRPLAVEFHGCAWHGCPKCFDAERVCPNGRTAALNYETTMRREDIIKQTFDLVSIWECEVNQQLKSDKEMKTFFDKTPSFGPLNPRDAYFGGRTGPLKMVCDFTKSNSGKKISYLDVQSLYPYTNYVTDYPIGIPDVSVLTERVHWTSSNNNPYKGLLKVVVLPPTNTTIPVIPMKVDERLLFPLCRTCAKTKRKDAQHRQPDYMCKHTDDERSFLCTITHNELNKALDRGYVVSYIGHGKNGPPMFSSRMSDNL